ncbi:ATP-binding cassette domain-containing protein [Brooklawnia cerclae]|uniref:ABC-type multidrug transport system ATPase subunit n=1 Tax=Brooklawnia cerclae TaxID=349934 RepID=A0ABX0SB32_9ACTN|nr:ATP-binding cassette domain-containing protein [Brooklawnia cerclae]NIH55539.1 ABC-type multidrug transport system ATPase subunit [Brooklawnia cerclae]
MAERTPAVVAQELSKTGQRGRVYGPVNLDMDAGSLTVVTGRAGSGKTSLLLTLVGRMRPDRGSRLTVLGRDLPRRALGVQHRSSIVGVAGLDDLDGETTVGASLRERQAWLAPWYRIVPRSDDAAVARACAPVFGDLPVPTARTVVHDLDEASDLLWRIALAMLSGPELIAVDDVDQLHDLDSRALVWERLRALTAGGVTVVAATSGFSDLRHMGWDELPARIQLPEPAPAF